MSIWPVFMNPLIPNKKDDGKRGNTRWWGLGASSGSSISKAERKKRTAKKKQASRQRRRGR